MYFGLSAWDFYLKRRLLWSGEGDDCVDMEGLVPKIVDSLRERGRGLWTFCFMGRRGWRWPRGGLGRQMLHFWLRGGNVDVNLGMHSTRLAEYIEWLAQSIARYVTAKMVYTEQKQAITCPERLALDPESHMLAS